MPQFPEDRAAVDVMKEIIVIVCLIRVSTIICKDIFDPAVTTFPLQSHVNDIAGRGCRELRWRFCQ